MATVDGSGLVTGVNVGSTAIIATSEGASDTAAITVTPRARGLTVTAGGLRTCALTAGGGVYCWGNGPLGNGSTAQSLVPVAVIGGFTFSAVTSGAFLSCGISTNATAYCWGQQPVPVPGDHLFTTVAIGDGYGPGHYCGLTPSGAAYCWGNNAYGQLGDGTTSGDQIENGWAVRSTPVAVVGGHSFVALTASTFDTCGLTATGTAYCWGDNEFYQLGDGSSASYSAIPVPVAGGLKFTSLSRSCGLTDTGAAYCWGANGVGNLGNGSLTDSPVPVAVTGGLKFTAITSSGGHGCGLTASGAAYCWGANGNGQLGIGYNVGLEQCNQAGGVCSPVPVAVAGELRFATISAGGQTTCGVSLDGLIYCWGDNSNGQLGNGTRGNQMSEPVQVSSFGSPPAVASITLTPESATVAVTGVARLSATARDANGILLVRPISWTSGDAAIATVDTTGLVRGVGSGSASVIATSEGKSDTAIISVGTVTFATVSAGGFSTCGLTMNGAAYCWPSPVPCCGIPPGGPAAVAESPMFSSLAVGDRFACGLTNVGAAYCWGQNDFGQLGSGATSYSSIPIAVTGGLSFKSITAGFEHACALTSLGAAYCWGGNFDGQLGNGDTTRRSMPVAVAGGLSFKNLAAGAAHTCGVMKSGGVACWGRNDQGQLGAGSTSGLEVCQYSVPCSTVPLTVTGGLSLDALGAGGWHTCGLTISGAAFCWGLNDAGQLGNGTMTSSAVPVAVAGALTFTAIASGGSHHTCALTEAGAAYCWGQNSGGQLGDGTTTGSAIPVLVAGDLTFGLLTTGYSHACGLTSASVAYCWGSNVGGLGTGTLTNSSVPMKVPGQP